MRLLRQVVHWFYAVGSQATQTSKWLLKLLIPISLATKLAQELGVVQVLAEMLEAPMSLLGLPGSAGIVWATAMLSGLFPAVLVYASIIGDATLSVAQVSVLASLMLIAHSLPTEVTVARYAGIRVRTSLLIRIAAALVYALLLHLTLEKYQLLQTPASMLPFPEASDAGVLAWAIAEAQRLGLICLTVFVLHFVMELLRAVGAIALVTLLLTPPLRLLGICPRASSIIITGFIMGVAIGGALIVKEANSGEISCSDVFGALTLLGLFHSVVDDTLLMLAVGADFTGIFWGRLLFALLVVSVLTRIARGTTARRSTPV